MKIDILNFLGLLASVALEIYVIRKLIAVFRERMALKDLKVKKECDRNS